MITHPLHEKALEVSRIYHAAEIDMIDILMEAHRIQLHKIFQKPSLFAYVQEMLGFEKDKTYAYIAVAKMAMQYPQVRVAIEAKRVSVSKVRRMVPHAEPKNIEELPTFASAHSQDDLEKKLAGIETAKIGPLTKVALTQKQLLMAKRVRTISSKNLKLADAIELALAEYLSRHDPVEKADRHFKSKENRVKTARPEKPQKVGGRQKPARTPLSAARKHAMNARDRGQCTFTDLTGCRCSNEKWVEGHHVKFVRDGGENDVENLTTLCAFHHDLTHRMHLMAEVKE